MATIQKSLSTKQDGRGYSQILFRVSISKNKKLRLKTNIFIPAKRWDEDKERINSAKAIGVEKNELTEKETSLKEIEAKVLKLCEICPVDVLDKEWIEKILSICKDVDVSKLTNSLIDNLIEQERHPEKLIKPSFFTLFEEYIQKQQHAFDQIKGHHVLMRILCRYEEYRNFTDKKKGFKLDIDTIDKETIEDFRDYISDEKSLADEYPTIFEELLSKYPLEINIKARSPKLVERGTNTVIKLMKKFKTFFNWLNKQGITNNHPFDGITVGTETYGTPIYITLEERNQIADYDLSNAPELAIQRDIFIFQSLIGCRVGDLLKMTKSNIVGDAIEYIAHKTKDERPVTLHVPLNDRAKAIIDKYKDCGDKLLPFITDQKYNVAIKKVFTACGITRIVTVLNPTTGEYEQKTINKVASSHMARRTFVGNLYKQVKDPNLVGALSGHVPGSKAFTRYRDIDNQIKQELVNLIN